MHTAGINYGAHQNCVCVLHSSLLMKGIEQSVTHKVRLQLYTYACPCDISCILSLNSATVLFKAAKWQCCCCLLWRTRCVTALANSQDDCWGTGSLWSLSRRICDALQPNKQPTDACTDSRFPQLAFACVLSHADMQATSQQHLSG